jgi:hypothetical protein
MRSTKGSRRKQSKDGPVARSIMLSELGSIRRDRWVSRAEGYRWRGMSRGEEYRTCVTLAMTRLCEPSMTRLEVVLGNITRTREALLGSSIQNNPGRIHPGIIWMLSVVAPSKFLTKAGIRSRECIRTPGEVTMASTTPGPSTLTHARDHSYTLALGNPTLTEDRWSSLTGQSILTPGRYLTSIVTGVQHRLASRDTLATHTLTLR